MEKRSFKKLTVLIFSMIFASLSFAQFVTQDNHVQIKIWAELDPIPGTFIQDENTEKEISVVKTADNEFDQYFKFAVNKINNLSSFVINGMLNGFTFEYVPYDKKRKVPEIWTYSANFDSIKELNNLEYIQNDIKDNILEVWVIGTRNESQKMIYNSFKSVNNPRISGVADVSVEMGTEGIKEAVSLAAKDAVRKYYSTKVKEKPREVTGKVLIVGEPRVYIRGGRYFVELDFFLQTDKIIPYQYF